MKAQSISTYGATSALRALVAKNKAEMLKAQQEATTGTVFDVGLSLGSKSGQTVSLRKEYDRLSVLTDMNKLVQQRMNATQTAAGTIIENTQNFLGDLTGANNTAESAATIAKSAKSILNSVTGLLNTSYNGEYIFAGVNTDVKPVADYTEGSAAQTAVRQAFQTHFGFAIDDPQVANITGDEMKAFLEGDFADEFNDANWAANWSDASDTVIKSRISPTETADTSISANADGFRKTIMSAVMVAEFATIGLNNSAFEALTHQAMQTTTTAITETTSEQTTLGLAQSRTGAATTRIAAQQKILNQSVLNLEEVDPYEAATRVNALKTQIETSYSLTVQLQNMSLLNYLR
ncbi:flagellar hook-associated family protein [Brucella tritici]|uniref:Flagellin n=1 Tax=Brucella tritici TaxID=94626 RepID=A0A6N6QGR0_9HYPH|nr:flagellar hook-associated family protein [Brucella tritici]MBJ6721986.1 flagellar hook-associated family protein [Bacillus sp. PR5]KAB2665373.1 flagellar hook-associated family protein [Brucella tritici]KAB2674755.1 flagellar hook-associated family protein [Brucella tritici]KAB2685649.1 flagellar hook-associated family protein [Brucella tritici]NKW10524.1 flagellar hook-associated family protein [Brucella tritici]